VTNQVTSPGQVGLGYHAWIEQNERAASKKVDFGIWWRWNTTFWRVAWIEATNELYAAERQPSDRFVLVTLLDKKEVTELMRKWFEGNDLQGLFQKCKRAPTPGEAVQA
jgi:hypothetical protein